VKSLLRRNRNLPAIGIATVRVITMAAGSFARKAANRRPWTLSASTMIVQLDRTQKTKGGHHDETA
jgi:hypothetical protein